MKWLLLCAALVMVGCVDCNCRQDRENKEKAAIAAGAPAPKPETNVNPETRMRVYKYDGSKQCSPGLAVSPAEMQKELVGIEVYAAESKMDHLMHPMICGVQSGKANVFTIQRKDLGAVQKLGYKEWIWE